MNVNAVGKNVLNVLNAKNKNKIMTPKINVFFSNSGTIERPIFDKMSNSHKNLEQIAEDSADFAIRLNKSGKKTANFMTEYKFQNIPLFKQVRMGEISASEAFCTMLDFLRQSDKLSKKEFMIKLLNLEIKHKKKNKRKL